VSVHDFECVLCGEIRSPEDGADDAVERVLGDAERGVCDDCYARLPGHVVEWAENAEDRRSAV
jgi:hypothetical protein